MNEKEDDMYKHILEKEFQRGKEQTKQKVLELIDKERKHHKKICDKHCDLPFEDITKEVEKI